jgi:hypothetical protein
MNRFIRGCALSIAATVVSGCVTPAPGADQVTITGKPADVSGCTAVGNIGVTTMRSLDTTVAKNQAVGLNANVILNTGAGGVAYHCDKKPGSTQ